MRATVVLPEARFSDSAKVSPLVMSKVTPSTAFQIFQVAHLSSTRFEPGLGDVEHATQAFERR